MMQTRTIAPFGVRMPADLKEWLKERAGRNRRSANSELLAVMEEARAAEKENARLAATGRALVTQ
ncbi:Arc family DNA-binding protein [Paraburkholderia sp. A3BS-1L]|uniref:Arc family DNA-binding protein n=1 Tax=Paraburkholderia sp. A3BS-1L TaxID=3028375 RepID=UPI003DA86864